MAIAPRMNSVEYQSAIRSPNAREKRRVYGGDGGRVSVLVRRPVPCSILVLAPSRGSGPSSGSKDIPHPSNCVQQLLLERPVDFLPQTASQDAATLATR